MPAPGKALKRTAKEPAPPCPPGRDALPAGKPVCGGRGGVRLSPTNLGASAEVFLFRHRPAREQKCPQKKAKAFIIGAFSDHTGKGPLKWTGWRLLCP